jgi:adenine phosphoribosyltransferase
MNLASYLRDVPDFPKPGIVFKDITPLLQSPAAMDETVAQITDRFRQDKIDKVAAIESRGFIFGALVASRLGVGFIPLRKPGKLPWRTQSVNYMLEYGSGTLEIHEDAVRKGERVIVVDDLLATGGTARAACELLERLGGRVVGCAFVVELAFLPGRKKLTGQRIEALIRIE